MIIGTGSLAKLLKDREGTLLCASGISNSNYEFDKPSATREADTIITNHLKYLRQTDHQLIYFSTISIFTSYSSYTEHKLLMEGWIKKIFDNYIILRIGNIWECTNPNTFLNYLRSHPDAEVRENEIKYMIHADELNMICQSLPLTGKHEISIFSEMLTVKECLKR